MPQEILIPHKRNPISILNHLYIQINKIKTGNKIIDKPYSDHVLQRVSQNNMLIKLIKYVSNFYVTVTKGYQKVANKEIHSPKT